MFVFFHSIQLGHWLMPSRVPPGQQFQDDPRAYVAHVNVREKSPLSGKSLKDAGLRHLRGLFIYEVYRPSTDETFPAPSHDFVLQGGDVLAVAGDVKCVDQVIYLLLL